MIFAPCPFRLEVLDECPSTNDWLLARRQEPGFHGRSVLALRQTGGHGRRGRAWWSGEGNLALSLGLSLPDGAPATLLPFFAGLAAGDALAPLLPAGADLRLKWPNDIYLNGKKLAGMLAQARQGDTGCDLVLGLGLNLREAPPGDEAVALGSGAPVPAVFARDFLEKLECRLATLKDFAALKAAWEQAARLRESEYAIPGEKGIYQALGLLPRGELEVRGSDGRSRVLASEEVSLRILPPPSA